MKKSTFVKGAFITTFGIVLSKILPIHVLYKKFNCFFPHSFSSIYLFSTISQTLIFYPIIIIIVLTAIAANAHITYHIPVGFITLTFNIKAKPTII